MKFPSADSTQLRPEPEPPSLGGHLPASAYSLTLLGSVAPLPRRASQTFSEKDKQSGAAQKLKIDRLPPEASPPPRRPLRLDSPLQAACSGQRPQGVRRARTPGATRCDPGL